MTLRIPDDFSKANVLISNDDGIHAQGIKVLEDCIESMGAEKHVVAPETEQSAAGHSLTIHTPLRIRKYDDNHSSVFGTPTDCAVMGIQHIMRDNPPNLVVSGINHGRNIADDVTYSGTVAVAIEATLLGIPAIAFSQYLGESHGDIDWGLAKKYIPIILKKLAGLEIDKHTLINVNLPLADKEPKGILTVPQGHYDITKDDVMECEDPRGKPYFWIKPPPKMQQKAISDDAGAIEAGYITITPLSLNMTNREMIDNIEKRINT